MIFLMASLAIIILLIPLVMFGVMSKETLLSIFFSVGDYDVRVVFGGLILGLFVCLEKKMWEEFVPDTTSDAVRNYLLGAMNLKQELPRKRTIFCGEKAAISIMFPYVSLGRIGQTLFCFVHSHAITNLERQYERLFWSHEMHIGDTGSVCISPVAHWKLALKMVSPQNVFWLSAFMHLSAYTKQNGSTEECILLLADDVDWDTFSHKNAYHVPLWKAWSLR